jgi:hypothetical protein
MYVEKPTSAILYNTTIIVILNEAALTIDFFSRHNVLASGISAPDSHTVARAEYD